MLSDVDVKLSPAILSVLEIVQRHSIGIFCHGSRDSFHYTSGTVTICWRHAS